MYSAFSLGGVLLASPITAQNQTTLPIAPASNFKVGQEFFWRVDTNISIVSFGGIPKTETQSVIHRFKIIDIGMGDLWKSKTHTFTGGAEHALEMERKKLRRAEGTFRIAEWGNFPYRDEPEDIYWLEGDGRFSSPRTEYQAERLYSAPPLSSTFNFADLFFSPIGLLVSEFNSTVTIKNRLLEPWYQLSSKGVSKSGGVDCVSIQVQPIFGGDPASSYLAFVRLSDGLLQRIDFPAVNGEFSIGGVQGKGRRTVSAFRIDSLPPRK